MDATLTLETTEAVAEVADGAAVVNGPEDISVDWDWVRWHQVERDVRRLRQRIFTASQAGDLKQVRNLQKLMLRSRGNALVAVRRVTELNAGRKTAGVDGKVAVDAQQKAELVDWFAAPRPSVVTSSGQAGVCAQEQRSPTSTRDSRHRRQMPSSSGGQRVGTRMGGPV